MFQNMKVDIIYYSTNTDFEMEFNLCGCCRMRLLTDKSPDRRTMVQSLARAVSRSKIIFVIGPLFEELGVINSVAGAISSKLSIADNKTYGIKSNDEINIISGSTPLVTPDGIFGGCIIESGPQTMILMTDNKSVRKSLMQTLIHPYIEELYANELKEKANVTSEIAQNNSSADDELILDSTEEADQLTEEQLVSEFISDVEETEEPEPIVEEKTELLTDDTPQSEEEPEIYNDDDSDFISEVSEVEELTDEDVLVSAGILFETEETQENSSDKPYIEPEEPDIIFEETEDYDYTDISAFTNTTADDQQYLAEDDDLTEEPKKFSLNMPILILTIVLLLTIAILCYCIFFIPGKNDTSSVAFIKETFDILFG